MSTLSPFGQILRIKTIYKIDTNNFYITFSDAISAYKAHSKLNNMKLVQCYLHSKVINKNNIRNSDDDYIPEVEILNQEHPKRIQHNKLKPIYNLVTVEDGHNTLKVFDFLNKQIGCPKLTPETFTRFGRNTYLVKVSKPGQGYMLRGHFKDFEDSGIINIKPYNDYNGSRGKIYNNDLAKLTPEELLNRCPENVVDVTNIKTFDRTTKNFVNTNAIILKFSDSILPDKVTIGPFRMKVKEYKAIPRTCKNCLRYGHTKNVCNKEKLCFKCSSSHPEAEDNVCPNTTKCFHCSGDHWTFNKRCPEYNFQEEVCNKAYTAKTSIKNAKILLNRPNNSISYASATKTPIQNTESSQPTTNTAVPTSSKTSATNITTTTPASPRPVASTTKSNAPTTTRSSVSYSTTARSTTSTVKASTSSAKSTLPTTTTSNTKPISTAAISSSSSKVSTSDIKKNTKTKSSSLLDLTSIEEDGQNILSTKYKIPKLTASSSHKSKDDTNLKTSNRFSCFSDESEEPLFYDTQMEVDEDHKRERKRKPEKTSEDLQSSLHSKRKLHISDSEKQKSFKSSNSNPKSKYDPKDVSSLSKSTTIKTKSKD